MSDVGRARSELVAGQLPKPERTPAGVLGTVVAIDHFGNLITNVESTMLGARQALEVRIEAGAAVRTTAHHSDGVVAVCGDVNRPGRSALIAPFGADEWLERHRAFERSRRRRPDATLLEPLAESRPLRRALARDLGARLGQGLFERVQAGELDRRGLVRLFSRRLETESTMTYVINLLRRPRARR